MNRIFSYRIILDFITFKYVVVMLISAIGLLLLKNWGKIIFIIEGIFVIIYKLIINIVWIYILEHFINYSNESIIKNSLNINLILIIYNILFIIILSLIIIKLIKIDFSENKNKDR